MGLGRYTIGLAPICFMSVVSCHPSREPLGAVVSTPEAPRPRAPAEKPREPLHPVLLADGYLAPSEFREELSGEFRGRRVERVSTRLAITTNGVRLEGTARDFEFYVPLVYEPESALCIERPLAEATARSHFGRGTDYARRYAFRVRFDRVTGSVPHRRGKTIPDGVQTVGRAEGSISAVLDDTSWIAGHFSAPIVHSGDWGGEELCKRNANTHAEKPRGFTTVLNGRPWNYHPVRLLVYPELSEEGPPGYELFLVNDYRTTISIRFTTLPAPNTCFARYAAHSADPGVRAAEPGWFELEVTDYVAAKQDSDGKLSGALKFAWQPTEVVGGELTDLPVTLGKRGVPMRRCGQPIAAASPECAGVRKGRWLTRGIACSHCVDEEGQH